MKTKLLRKIRKQYSIVYYPNGMLYDGEIFYKDRYVVDKEGCMWSLRPFDTRQKAINYILSQVRHKYSTYSVKNPKNKYKGIKVWYNG